MKNERIYVNIEQGFSFSNDGCVKDKAKELHKKLKPKCDSGFIIMVFFFIFGF